MRQNVRREFFRIPIMQRSDDLKNWRLFAAVAKTGSISSACRFFQTDAANLSRHLSQFEESLGAGPLLDRSVRPLTLTENGREVLACAEKMLQLKDELMQGLNRDPESLKGIVRVGLPPMVLRDLLTPRLLEFTERFHDIDLRVDEYTSGLPIDFENWRGDLMDVVVTYGPSPVNQNCVQIRYGQGLLMPCASPAYIRRCGQPETPDDLVNHVGLVVSNGLRQASPALKREGRSVPLHFGRVMHFNSASAAKTAALLGSGIHINLPTLHCFREIREGTLVPVLRGWEQPCPELYIYTRPECIRQARVRLFIEWYRRVLFDFQEECLEVWRPYLQDDVLDIMRPDPLSKMEFTLSKVTK